MTIRVVLVDDKELVRVGFRTALDSRDGIDIVGEATDGDPALALLEEVRADVVLVDAMSGSDVVEVTRRICALEAPPSILILTAFDLDESAYDALRSGAAGVVVKDTPFSEIATAIRHVHSGDAVVAPGTTRRLLHHYVRPPSSRAHGEAPRAPVGMGDLDPRERDVLQHIAQGRSNSEIAVELTVTEDAVQTHVGQILAKLGLPGRVQVMILAYETGIVQTGGF